MYKETNFLKGNTLAGQSVHVLFNVITFGDLTVTVFLTKFMRVINSIQLFEECISNNTQNCVLMKLQRRELFYKFF